MTSRLISSSNSTNHSSNSSLKKARSRNDSSNVFSLLAPEISEHETKPCIYSNGNHKLLHLDKIHCESCYCRDAPVPPLLRLPFKHQQEECRFKNVCLQRHRQLHDDKSQRRPTATDDGEDETKPSELKVSVACQTHDEVFNKTFEEVSAFRKDRYFDCHSLQNLLEDAPVHKCVHKFTVNDRLMLEPINCDSFGVSRCEICNKPMERRHKQQDPPTTEQRPINNIKKLYEHDLMPPRLNISSGEERIEIKVPEGISRKCFGTDSDLKSKRYVPLGNSFALRYQKRRI